MDVGERSIHGRSKHKVSCAGLHRQDDQELGGPGCFIANLLSRLVCGQRQSNLWAKSSRLLGTFTYLSRRLPLLILTDRDRSDGLALYTIHLNRVLKHAQYTLLLQCKVANQTQTRSMSTSIHMATSQLFLTLRDVIQLIHSLVFRTHVYLAHSLDFVHSRGQHSTIYTRPSLGTDFRT